jgi:SAM-dependent methyltransferase
MSEEGSNWYHEAGEVQYHANVFSADPFVRATIARNRALKLQPLIGAQDRLLDYDLSGYGREACEAEGIAFTDDLESLSGRQFDTVLCHHVLEHVPCPLETLQVIRGLLAPGGRLILVVPFERGRRFRRYAAGDIDRHLYSWHPLALGNLLDEAGMAVSSISLGPTGAEQRLAPGKGRVRYLSTGHVGFAPAGANERDHRPCAAGGRFLRSWRRRRFSATDTHEPQVRASRAGAVQSWISQRVSCRARVSGIMPRNSVFS